MTTPRDIISYLLPFVATAGAYSAQIQREVGTHEAKDGATIFHHALSDADLTIQSYLEVVLLAQFPFVSFFSEEQDQSLNRKYFAPQYDLEVLLDPIDGTRAYIDNREFYQIIVTIHDACQIVGSICYMPRRGRCYIATRGEGAYLLSRDDMESRRPGRRFTLTHTEGPALVFNAPEIEEKVSRVMEVKDLLTSYQQEQGRFYSTDLLEGRAGATLHAPVQAIDGGSIALIAEEAGALVSDFEGRRLESFRDSPKRIQPNAIVAVNADVQRRILSAIAGA